MKEINHEKCFGHVNNTVSLFFLIVVARRLSLLSKSHKIHVLRFHKGTVGAAECMPVVIERDDATIFQMRDNEFVDEIAENKTVNRFHSILLILAMVAILCVVGYLTFGLIGFVVAVLLTLVSCLLGQRVSTAWIMRMYKAAEISPNQAPELFQAFASLSQKAGLKYMPKLYYIPTRMPNAFATGFKKTSAVAITDGILRMMNAREIKGILAHEIAHLMHRDTKVMALADTMSRLTSTASRIGFFLILFSGLSAFLSEAFSPFYLIAFVVLFLSPTAMILLQLALSRSREFNADLGAVQLTGDALGLASALNKLERLTKRTSIWQRLMQPGQRRSQPAFLRTHPPTPERVSRLMEHADEQQLQEYARSKEKKRIIPQHQPRRIVIQLPRVRPRPKYRITSGMWR